MRSYKPSLLGALVRDYGLPPMIWDSEPPDICEGGRDHVWGDDIPPRGKSGWDTFEHKYHSPGSHKTTLGSTMKKIETTNSGHGQFCQVCGTWRGCLGLEPTPELYIQHMVDIFREVRRVLRSDGTLWLNMGDSYAGGGRTGKEGIQKWGGIESSNQNRKYGVPTDKIEGIKPKDLCGIPWMLAFALRADGWYLRSDIIWHKPNPMPESVTDRPTKAHEYLFLLTKSAKYFYDADAIREPHKRDFSNEGGGWENGKYKPKENTAWKNDPSCKRGANQTFYHNPSGRNKRTVWTIPTKPFPEAHFATFPPALIEPCILAGTSEKGCCVECKSPWERVVEKIDTGKTQKMTDGWDTGSGGHGTIHRDGREQGETDKPVTSSKTISWKPTCKCTMDKGVRVPCIVLDPFFGSGTTGIVAYNHGRKFIGIELSKPYLDDIAIPRIEKETEQLKLFK